MSLAALDLNHINSSLSLIQFLTTRGGNLTCCYFEELYTVSRVLLILDEVLQDPGWSTDRCLSQVIIGNLGNKWKLSTWFVHFTIHMKYFLLLRESKWLYRYTILIASKIICRKQNSNWNLSVPQFWSITHICPPIVSPSKKYIILIHTNIQ